MRSLALCLLLLVASRTSAELKIAVTDAFHETLRLIAADYQAQYQVPVRLTAAPASELFEQIRGGADYDIFFSNNTGYPRQLIAEGLADADSFVVYASGELVLWCPQTEEAPELKGLAGQGTLAIANPLAEPFGRAAQELLEKQGLWETLKRRVVLEDSLKGVLAAVVHGKASCGFISARQWLALAPRDRGAMWQAPPRRDTLLKQAAIVMKRSPQRWVGRDFLVYMQSPQAFEILRQAGYRPAGAALPAPPVLEEALDPSLPAQ